MMQQRQQRNEREGFPPSAGEPQLHRLSARVQATVQAMTAWAQHCSAGTVDVTYTCFPPEDDYGSEVLITLQLQLPCGGVLMIGVISDTTVPFHVHLGNVHDLVIAAGLTHARMVLAHLHHSFLIPALTSRPRTSLPSVAPWLRHRSICSSASSDRRYGQSKPGSYCTPTGRSGYCTGAADQYAS